MTVPDAQPGDSPEALPEAQAGMLTPRKIILQVIFWLIGLALLGWIIWRAIETGDWDRLATAEPAMIAALLGCTVLSSFLNGMTFWLTIRSVRRVGFGDMQLLNVVANMLNYAPVRAGAIARVVFHHRVDQLGLLQIGAWFAMIGYVLVLGVGSCLLATLVYDRFDLIWLLLVIGQMILGGLVTQVVVGHPLIIRHGRGIDRMIRDHRALWGAVVLRLVDIGAFTGRMAAAMAILGIHLPVTHIIVLALVALASSLIPFGRVGFREFCVAAAAARLGTLSEDVTVPWAQLALVESAGEAIVFIPLGAVAMLWYRRRWRQAGRRSHPAPTP